MGLFVLSPTSWFANSCIASSCVSDSKFSTCVCDRENVAYLFGVQRRSYGLLVCFVTTGALLTRSLVCDNKHVDCLVCNKKHVADLFCGAS